LQFITFKYSSYIMLYNSKGSNSYFKGFRIGNVDKTLKQEISKLAIDNNYKEQQTWVGTMSRHLHDIPILRLTIINITKYKY